MTVTPALANPFAKRSWVVAEVLKPLSNRFKVMVPISASPAKSFTERLARCRADFTMAGVSKRMTGNGG